MSGLRINYEKKPIRCEICHQSDCFDSQRNSCTRCAQIDLLTPIPLATIEQNHNQENSFIDTGTLTGAASGIVFGLFLQIWQSQSFLRLSTYGVVFGTMLIGALWGALTGEGIKRFH